MGHNVNELQGAASPNALTPGRADEYAYGMTHVASGMKGFVCMLAAWCCACVVTRARAPVSGERREGCEDTWACSVFGQCSLTDGNCIATRDDDCAASAECSINGLCHANNGCCIAAANGQGCSESAIFAKTGACPKADPYCTPYATVLAQNPSAPATATYERDVQPIFQRWCSDCHSGKAHEECEAGCCLVDAYADVKLPSKIPSDACSGKTMAVCLVVRLRESSDATSPYKLLTTQHSVILLPEPQLLALERWVDGGLRER